MEADSLGGDVTGQLLQGVQIHCCWIDGYAIAQINSGKLKASPAACLISQLQLLHPLHA